MPKRKSEAIAEDRDEARNTPRRRSTRLRTSRPGPQAEAKTAAPPAASARGAGSKGAKAGAKKAATPKAVEAGAGAGAGLAKGKGRGRPASTKPEKTAAPPKPSTKEAGNEDGETGEQQYWLMKAEPETRLENGIDVSFSIDDLAARTEPEPWDGIRNYVARNNLRAMKKGDVSFFYHSNCKEPGIVGIMEIVQEHSPDLSAHDPMTPYYDASSKPSDPKWSVVHVEFRRKFAVPITLKELREMGSGPGKPLESMQMLKQTRLSVSRVSASEWAYLLGVAEEREKPSS